MENHARVMVICLPFDQRDVCHRFSIGKRAAPIGKDACFHIDFGSNYGDLFTINPQTFLVLDL
ncbi:MAG: hypothetical protein WCH03_08210 [Flavobacteriia bacterium]